jgi:hypothetical protein
VTWWTLLLLCRERRYETNATRTTRNGAKTIKQWLNYSWWQHRNYFIFYLWFSTDVMTSIAIGCCCTVHRKGTRLPPGPGRLDRPTSKGKVQAHTRDQARRWARTNPWRCRRRTSVQHAWLQGSPSDTARGWSMRRGWRGAAAPGPRRGGARSWPDMAWNREQRTSYSEVRQR